DHPRSTPASVSAAPTSARRPTWGASSGERDGTIAERFGDRAIARWTLPAIGPHPPPRDGAVAVPPGDRRGDDRGNLPTDRRSLGRCQEHRTAPAALQPRRGDGRAAVPTRPARWLRVGLADGRSRPPCRRAPSLGRAASDQGNDRQTAVPRPTDRRLN